MAEKRSDIFTNILAILMLLEIAALAGLAGYVVLTGRITKEQLRLAHKVWIGEVSEQVVTEAESWKKHLQDEEAAKQNKVSGADAAMKLAATNAEAEAARLGIERQLKDLQDRENLVQLKLQELDQKRAGLEEQEKRINQRLAADREGSGQKNFQMMIGILTALKPPDIKAALMQFDDQKVVEILKALDERTAGKVLAEYRTPAEIQLKTRYLQAIGYGDTRGTQTASGK